MTLEEATKKAFEKKYDRIFGYRIDGQFVNLNCVSENDTVFPARIIFGKDNTFHTDSPQELDSVVDLANEIKKNLGLG